MMRFRCILITMLKHNNREPRWWWWRREVLLVQIHPLLVVRDFVGNVVQKKLHCSCCHVCTCVSAMIATWERIDAPCAIRQRAHMWKYISVEIIHTLFLVLFGGEIKLMAFLSLSLSAWMNWNTALRVKSIPPLWMCFLRQLYEGQSLSLSLYNVYVSTIGVVCCIKVESPPLKMDPNMILFYNRIAFVNKLSIRFLSLFLLQWWCFFVRNQRNFMRDSKVKMSKTESTLLCVIVLCYLWMSLVNGAYRDMLWNSSVSIIIALKLSNEN